MPPIRPTRLATIIACTAWAAAAIATPTLAQPARVPDPIHPKELAIAPATAPVPAMKYRLSPSSADLNPGDAAPIYLRIRYQTPDALWNEITPTCMKWREMPLDRFPTAEARKFLDRWSRQLEQIEFGARRKTCDWNYTVPEQRLDVINVALSDGQQMRQWLRLVDLKARVEIAEGRYDQAIGTIGTGLAFSRHIAEGPFLINGLIGLAGVHLMLDRCEELIARPGAPNLYWALSALPSPTIDFSHEVDTEQKLCENMIPELTEARSNAPRSAAEWAALLSRTHARIVKWSRDYPDPEMKALSTWDLARLKSESLPAARAYLKARPDLDDGQRAGMSDDQVVALFLAGRQRELWDDLFKASHLPPREGIPQLAAASRRIQAAGSGPLVLFASMIPSLEAVMKNRLKIDRRVAALRLIEALRLHSAAHGGQLPESLDQIKEVPVPEDPATGEPFIYRAADEAAILHGLRADLPPPWLSYRITIRR